MMKVFKKVLVAAMSIAAVATMSINVFADAIADKATYEVKDSVPTVSMTDYAGDITATEGQMTVVVVPTDFGADSTAADIYYINQDEIGTAFDGILANMGLKAELDGTKSYEVRIGGENVTDVLTFSIKAKTVTPDVVYGDVNGDGDVLLGDSTLLAQYLAQWDVEVKAGADVNGDGDVLLGDSTLLAQYLAQWDVTLGPVAQ